MRISSKLWPGRHQRYQDMSVLAATAQLDGPQMCELNDHVATCDACRNFLESIAQASMQAMPLFAERSSTPDIVPPEGMRARFLYKLVAEQLQAECDQHPVLQEKPLSEKPLSLVRSGGSHRGKPSAAVGELSTRRFDIVSSLWRHAAALAVCGLIVLLGIVATRIATRNHETAAQTPRPSPLVSASNSQATVPDQVVLLERQKEQLESDLAPLRVKVVDAETERKVLGEKLADADKKLAALTIADRGRGSSATRENQQMQNEVSSLHIEVETLRSQLDQTEAKLTAQRLESQGLRTKLEETESNLQREQDQKSARSQIGDLVAARNLHIVDVYDANSKGKRQPSFGRVFYIEGKSLVFYAYDLEDHRRPNTKVAFHVWGEKAGIKETTRSLGVLRNDDANEGRWTMTVEDPKILSQINSVFVTVEPANKEFGGPRGKKVLYAFFGSPPNHP
jgi:predicted  nucleic acid-binding Zn-ribbon protein